MKRKAFSLVEILLTMVLLCILFSCFIVHFGGAVSQASKIDNLLMSLKVQAYQNQTETEFKVEDAKIVNLNSYSPRIREQVKEINQLFDLENTEYTFQATPGISDEFELNFYEFATRKPGLITLDRFGNFK